MLFKLNLKPIKEGEFVAKLDTRKVGSELVQRLRKDLKMSDLELWKIEDTVMGGGVDSYSIYLSESLVFKCPLFKDTNIVEVLVDNLGLNRYMKIGYEITNCEDITIHIKPDFQTQKVNQSFVNDGNEFTSDEIKNIKIRYFFYEEAFFNEWEQMGFPTVFQIRQLATG